MGLLARIIGLEPLEDLYARLDDPRPPGYKGRPPWPIKTATDRKLWRAWNGKCTYCGRLCWKLPDDMLQDGAERATRDHVVPLIAGGAPSDLDNLVICCWPCNEGKGAILPIDLDTKAGQDRALGLHNLVASLATLTPIRKVPLL